MASEVSKWEVDSLDRKIERLERAVDHEISMKIFGVYCVIGLVAMVVVMLLVGLLALAVQVKEIRSGDRGQGSEQLESTGEGRWRPTNFEVVEVVD